MDDSFRDSAIVQDCSLKQVVQPLPGPSHLLATFGCDVGNALAMVNMGDTDKIKRIRVWAFRTDC